MTIYNRICGNKDRQESYKNPEVRLETNSTRKAQKYTGLLNWIERKMKESAPLVVMVS
jgi:hypothetical protein